MKLPTPALTTMLSSGDTPSIASICLFVNWYRPKYTPTEGKEPRTVTFSPTYSSITPPRASRIRPASNNDILRFVQSSPADRRERKRKKKKRVGGVSNQVRGHGSREKMLSYVCRHACAWWERGVIQPQDRLVFCFGFSFCRRIPGKHICHMWYHACSRFWNAPFAHYKL